MLENALQAIAWDLAAYTTSQRVAGPIGGEPAMVCGASRSLKITGESFIPLCFRALSE